MPVAKRRCPKPGCDELVPCSTHVPSNRNRPKTAERGYGADHQADREKWAPLVAAGQVSCRRGKDCRFFPDTLIHRGQPWQLGHPDEECSDPKAPEHRRCNTGAPGLIRGRRSRRTT